MKSFLKIPMAVMGVAIFMIEFGYARSPGPDDIRNETLKHIRKFDSCYIQARNRDPGISEKLKVTLIFTLRNDGRVINANVPDAPEGDFRDCLKRVAERDLYFLPFPSGEKEIDVKQPINLHLQKI